MTRRAVTCTLLVAAAALVAAAPAAAKEGVRATLTSTIPLDAAAGTPLHVTWTLAYPGENGRQHPFGAGGVFVRLRSATGAPAETGYASGDGSFATTVVVPEGGIADVQVGLRGWSGGKAADMFFPITNDPLPGRPHVVPAETHGSSRAWIFVAIAAAVTLAALGARRRAQAAT